MRLMCGQTVRSLLARGAAAVAGSMLLALAAAAPAAAQAPRVETGRVEVRVDRTYARLVFTFTDRPAHQVTAHPGVMVIRFDRPVDIGLQGVAEALRGLVSTVRRDPDGQAIRFALTRRLRVNTAEAADQLYVDLLPEPWTGAAPTLPPEVVAELARRAEEAERIRREELDRQRRRAASAAVPVSIAEASTFSRLAFRFTERPSATVTRTDRELRLVFDRPGAVDVAAVRTRLPRFVESFQAVEEDFRLIVTLEVDPARDVRTFVDATTFNIDVVGPERERGVVVPRADGSVGPEPERQDGAATTIRGAADDRPMQPRAERRQAEEDPPPRTARPVVVAPERPAQLRPAERAGAAPRGFRPNETRIEAVQNGPVTELRFLFARETPAAVFLRGRTLWLVFDTDTTIDPNYFRTELPRLVRNASRERAGTSEIVRLELDEPKVIAAQVEGTAWTVVLGDAPPGSLRAVDTAARVMADGRGAIIADVPRPSRGHDLVDPLVGDTLTVVTAFAPTAAFVKHQRFVEFEVLQTAHGMAVRRIADDIAVRIVQDGVQIERDAGLSVTTGSVGRVNVISPLAAPDVRLGFVDFEGWKLGPVEQYQGIRARLVERIAAAEGPARTAARLDLVRFFLSHQLGIEALGMMQLTAREDPAAEREAAFRALRGIAAMLARRFEITDRDFSDPELDESPDIALWRGLLAHERRDWQRARRELQRAQAMLTTYPRPLQARALAALTESALEMRDIGGADLGLDEISGLDPSARGQARVALLRGRLLEAAGRDDAALDAYLQAQRSYVPDVAAEAIFRRTALATRLQRMDAAVAIDTLEALAIRWRGDTLEVETYRLLARIYMGDRRPREAFRVFRIAQTIAPDHEIVRSLHDEVREAFANVFLDADQGGRSPLETLALFYDYRELTPPGLRGDEVIRNLAERLVDVDLLEQAAQLLDHQVENRLQGAARAEVGAYLALVHLMNRDAERALLVLRRTRLSTVSNELERRRTLIEARALAALGRGELAIELLGDDGTADAVRTRAELLWESRRYAEAARETERLLGEVWRRTTPLTDAARMQVLRAAVGYALANDRAAIERLRTRYAARLADTPESGAFQVLTSRVETTGAEFRQIARALAQIDTLQAFLRDYRRRYAEPAQAAGG